METKQKDPQLIDAYKQEIKHRWFSSRRKIIKTIGLIFVPFVYAFICIFALWNPLGNINKIPAAIVSFEQPSLVVGDFNSGSDDAPVKFGVVQHYTHNGQDTPITPSTTPDSIPYGAIMYTDVGTSFTKAISDHLYYQRLAFSDVLMQEWRDNKLPGLSYDAKKQKYAMKLSDDLSLTNIDYINYANGNPDKYASYKDNKWNNFNTNYYAQINIPDITTSSLMNYFDADLNNRTDAATFLDKLKNEKFNFYTTYEKNFVTAQIIDRFSDFGGAFLTSTLPSLASFAIDNILSWMTNHSDDYMYTATENKTYTNPQYTVKIDDTDQPIDYDTFSITTGTHYAILNNQIGYPVLANQPSIEGKTDEFPWNSSESPKSFIHTIRNLTKTVVDIPGVSTIIANALNEAINNKISNIPGAPIRVYLTDYNIKQIFSSDSLLTSFLFQDPRLIKGGSEDFFVDVDIGGFSLPAPYSFLLSWMCYKADGNTNNIFQDIKLLPLMGTGNTYITKDYGSGVIYYYADNIPAFLFDDDNGYKSFKGNLKNNIKVLSDAIASSTVVGSLSDFMTKNVNGSQYRQYGIGVGQLFICVGLWVGAFTQIMVYDRKKKVKKLKTHKWFFSKTLLMYSTCVLQVLLLGLALGILGWFSLGSAYALEWLFMLFMSLIFVIIIQSLWFCFRDRAIAFFVIVVYLVINIGMGLGTFPAFMQFPVVEYLSYLTPFHYMMQIQGAIIYGVTGHVPGTTLYVFENIGILLLFALAFLALGLWQSHSREREIFYGTCSRKKLSMVLKQMHLNKYLDAKWRVVWSKLPKEHMPDVALKVQTQFPYERPFQWFKKQKELKTDKDIVEIE